MGCIDLLGQMACGLSSGLRAAQIFVSRWPAGCQVACELNRSCWADGLRAVKRPAGCADLVEQIAFGLSASLPAHDAEASIRSGSADSLPAHDAEASIR